MVSFLNKKRVAGVGMEVIATLVGLVFAVPGLDFEKPIDHFEAFSGSAESMAVTRGEWEEWGVSTPSVTGFYSELGVVLKSSIVPYASSGSLCRKDGVRCPLTSASVRT